MNKSILILICLFLILSNSVHAQKQEPIKIEKRWGTVFTQNGKILKPRHLLEITSSNPEAYTLIKKAKSNYDAGMVFGAIGGFMVGFPCGTALAGGDPEWALAGIGAGLIAVSIPFTTAYIKHTKNAVSIYNDGLTPVKEDVASINFGLTTNGIGLQLTF